jgi:hypothetical protein
MEGRLEKLAGFHIPPSALQMVLENQKVKPLVLERYPITGWLCDYELGSV